MDPNAVDAFYNRGNAHLHCGKLDNALSDFNKTLRMDANFTPAFRQRAAVYMQQEKYDRALEDYNKYLEIRPEDAAAYNNRATLKYITGNIFGAMEDYDLGIRLDPTMLTMHLNQADLKSNCGQHKAAFTVLNTAMKYHRHSAEIWFKRGQLQQEMANYQAAIADFDRAIELSAEERGPYYLARGKAFKALNWHREACQDLNRAVH